MKPTLELPKTLRLLEPYEALDDSIVLERIKLSKTANIVEGYTLVDNEATAEFAFTFFAEINIDNSRLWNVFLVLCDELPDQVSLIYNVVDGSPNYGEYTSKLETIAFLKQYKKEIVSDTLIEIGLIFQTQEKLIEVFIADCKYVKFWGVDSTSFLETMKKFNLAKVEGLEFMDEYPKARQKLSSIEKNVKTPEELQQIFHQRFQFINLYNK